MAKTKHLIGQRHENEVAILKRFGENLRKIRENRELSQEEVAYQTGFSRSYYTEVETGKRNISLLNILKISFFLKVELDELIKVKDCSI